MVCPSGMALCLISILNAKYVNMFECSTHKVYFGIYKFRTCCPNLVYKWNVLYPLRYRNKIEHGHVFIESFTFTLYIWFFMPISIHFIINKNVFGCFHHPHFLCCGLNSELVLHHWATLPAWVLI
jgi:hypothetical protein